MPPLYWGEQIGFHREKLFFLGFGVGLTYHDKPGDGTVTASVPHPFFFNQPRSVSGQATGLGRSELGINFDAVWLAPAADRVQLLLLAGPSVIRVTQELVTDISVRSSYPFDQATFDSVASSQQTKSSLGFNAGADLAYMFTSRIGVGGSIQYSHARATLSAADGGTAA